VLLVVGGVLRYDVVWSANKTRWPPPQKRTCCWPSQPSLLPAGPLAPGRYRVRATAPVEWPAVAAPSAEIEIDVTK
jgi:hypothetical protein